MITALLCTDDDDRAEPLAAALADRIALRRACDAPSAIVQIRDADLVLLDPSFCDGDPAVADTLRELAVSLYVPVMPLPDRHTPAESLAGSIETTLSGLHARDEVRDSLRRH